MQPNHHRSDLTGEAVTASHRREILHRNAPSIWSISSSDMDETSTEADV
jgi:hypothetical protein